MGNARSLHGVVTRPVVLVGGGKMGLALLEGWLKGGLDPLVVRVIDPYPSEALARSARDQGFIVTPTCEHVRDALVVLAIKPDSARTVAAGLAPLLEGQALVLSVMAGVAIPTLRALLPGALAVVRAMPNLPAAIGRGAIVVACERGTSDADRRVVKQLLRTSGVVEWLDEESLIDAATALSGSGPGYLFHVVECLAEAGARLGLPAEVAARLARATFEGTGALLENSARTPGELRADVTSPGGTTEAGLNVLRRDGRLSSLFSEALAAAERRARDLDSSQMRPRFHTD